MVSKEMAINLIFGKILPSSAQLEYKLLDEK
jgi:hypothetical protein